MKAKISYTIDIKDIPWEVTKLLTPELGRLEDFLKDMDSSITKDNVDLSLVKIEMLRRLLLQVDTRAAECYSMLSGYKNATEPSSDKESEEAEDVSVPE